VGLLSTGSIARQMVEASARSASAITSGAALPFGRDDAIDQARALAALMSSSEIAAPVVLG
jgi:hypothetical protein